MSRTAFALAWLLAAPVPMESRELAVVLEVLDGDTFRAEVMFTGVYETRRDGEFWPGLHAFDGAVLWRGSVRVAGVDAPEKHARCATERTLALSAWAALDDLLTSRFVELWDVRHDKYARRVAARVRVLPSGEDVAQWLVSNGHARRYDGRSSRMSWCR